ncbi:MAG TPA: PVC-type heme-binding CxxCH protein [Pirellulales bacterium]|jgi:putative membrane-bound dehydrogenase-like protein|nr:PVC-type heme-binding CxxCH protein [Pirellulales bacterium]
MSLPHSRAARLSLQLILLAVVSSLVGAAAALAEHGQFDKSDVNPREEALIYTPSGRSEPGKPMPPPKEKSARVNVTVVELPGGKPTPCRVNVIGADGNYYEPQDNPLADYSLIGTWPERLAGNRPSKAPIRYFGHFFYTTGSFTVDVPAGAVRIEVWKGFEHRPKSEQFDIAAGASRDVRIELERASDVSAGGWYSADLHLHFARASDADDKTIFDLLEAEDIRLGTILCYNETNAYPGTMPELVTPQLRGLGRKSIRSRGPYQIISGQEYRNVVSGHMNLYLRDNLVLEGSRLDPNRGPAFGTIAMETREKGGYAFHAHGGYAQEIWADIVAESTHGVELLQFGIYRGIGLDGWYRVLNCGFRFPGVAASDYPACRKLGDCRTYVHVDSEPTFEKWLAGAAAGRSFMTSGPLVLLEIDGKRPGETILTENARPLTVAARVKVSSEVAPVTDVQLIVNGRVVAESNAEPKADGGQQLVLERPLEITEPSWIAARAFSKSATGNADAEAHTNPVYVYLDGKAPFKLTDVDWLLERVNEQIADHQARADSEKKESLDYIRRSRELLMDIRRGQVPSAVAQAREGLSQRGPQTPTAATLRGESLAEFLKSVPARPPAEAVKSFQTLNDFQMQLVAHEPDVTDPVAACFDENGGMYVGEMIDYPYRPKEGQTPLGRVRYLEDTDGDGVYEHSWVFADAIVWPTGVVCWKGGVFVAAAPDLWYLKDTDGDHRADVREKIYTGFGDRNQQGVVNNLNWHVDHKIYGSGSTNGGAIRPAGKNDSPPIVLSSRDFRFDPRTARFETVSGSKQFGNAFDDWFNRFLCSESKPAYHVVLPQQYLARNPHLAVPTALEDLAPGVTPIYRISPVERWREVRSSRRLAVGERSPTSAGLSHNVIDAAAGLTIYRGHAYPPEYRGNLIIGCSQNNLVHRRKVIPAGPTFRSERADANTEFVRSDDTWFRPVNCINAPDGTIYVLDMSREIIESVHIANDVVAHLDLTNGRDKGRIYRLAPPGFKPPPRPQLGKASTAELVGYLEHPGGWWRDTASRLIFERQDRSAIEPLRRQLGSSKSDVGRMHTLWALEGLGALEERDLALALADSSAGVREHAVRLAEPRLRGSSTLANKVLELANDDSARVRFQVAFTLGELNDSRASAALALIARRDVGESWTRTAVLSSCASRAGELAALLARDPLFVSSDGAVSWFEQLAEIVGARNQPNEVGHLLETFASVSQPAVRQAMLVGLGAGLARSGITLENARGHSGATARGALDRAIADAAKQAVETSAPTGQREAALRLLGYSGGNRVTAVLPKLLEPAVPESLSLAAVRTLARGNNDQIARQLIASWRAATPKLQEEIIGALSSRTAWATLLLAACRDGSVNPSQVTAARRTALVTHSDPAVRSEATAIFGALAAARNQVIANYRGALDRSGDARRGEQIYERECTSCHRLAERGFAVGPNLALTRNRSPQALLEAILDPNREVQPNFVNYVVTDDTGRTSTGLIGAETANSITLVREKGQQETIQKSHIEEIHSTGKSLMPDGLEEKIDVAAFADLLAFLKQVQYDIGTLPDFAPAKE